ncbi:Phytocyanin domain-containing protein [Favolaschia claudopus]|uniref:Phytocyanin domain-containing protein n=1 Tax=Favolaschia claudopus TaxID=2862362 RepID=A0AAW0APH1_9AGAR
MVLIAPLLGAAVFFSGLAAGLPTNSYDSGSSNYGASENNNNNYGGSSNNNNYGGSSNNNYGGDNNNNNYGGGSNNNNYGGGDNNKYETSTTSMMMEDKTTKMMDKTTTMMKDTTTMMEEKKTTTMMEEKKTTTMMEEKSTTTMMEEKSTSTVESTSTTTSMNTYSTPSYGSGYWGGSGYEDCVNKCIADFGSTGGGGDNGGSYQATATSDGSYGSKGNGATHTIIVAPHKGVFRMVPFATNASVGDTLEFHWGADGHTVTKSSSLLPCNKSSQDPVFATGTRNESFVFTQVVNDTNPLFYFCATPGHCEKGMFGIINPAMAAPGSPSSLSGMMQSMAATDSNLAAYAAYSNNITASNDAASAWGGNMDMSSMPDWSRSLFATNVLFTRAVLGMNPDVLKGDNSIDLSSVAKTPLMVPTDIQAPLDASSAPQPPADDSNNNATPAGAAASDPAGAPQSSEPAKNGASSIASPRLLVAAGVVLATIFAL